MGQDSPEKPVPPARKLKTDDRAAKRAAALKRNLARRKAAKAAR